MFVYNFFMFIEMCPPLISDSLNINCTLNGNYANCSNPSIYGTKATPFCKPTHKIPNGQEETPIELLCQSNGMWNNQLYRCIPRNCIFLFYIINLYTFIFKRIL